MYRGLTNDFVSFVITRWGNTNATAYTVAPTSITLGGTAVFGTDYKAGPQPVSYTVNPASGAGSTITVSPGDTTETFEVGLPQPHATFTGNQTITVSGGTPSGSYTFSGSATAMLLDNLNPPETILWRDALSAIPETS